MIGFNYDVEPKYKEKIKDPRSIEIYLLEFTYGF